MFWVTTRSSAARRINATSARWPAFGAMPSCRSSSPCAPSQNVLHQAPGSSRNFSRVPHSSTYSPHTAFGPDRYARMPLATDSPAPHRYTARSAARSASTASPSPSAVRG